MLNVLMVVVTLTTVIKRIRISDKADEVHGSLGE